MALVFFYLFIFGGGGGCRHPAPKISVTKLLGGYESNLLTIGLKSSKLKKKIVEKVTLRVQAIGMQVHISL